MLHRFAPLIGIALATLILAGCMSPRSFVDPTVPKVSYADLAKRPEPLRLRLSVEFQRNGQPFPRADSTLKDNTERVLRGTGVVLPVKDQGVGDIRVTLNNIADTDAAKAKGFGTGFTFDGGRWRGNNLATLRSEEN